MIHIGETALEQILTTHQRISRNQCMCGVELQDGLAVHQVAMVEQGQQE